MARRVKKLTVTHVLTSSDHTVIAFEIKGQPATLNSLNDPKIIKYDWRSTDWTEFRKTLRVLKGARSTDLGCSDVETCTRALSQVLATACETHMSRARVTRLKPAPWWNSTLDREVKILGRWKAKMRNVRNAFTKRALRRRYLLRKVAFKRTCYRARRDAWREFVTDVGNDEPWGPVYRWAKIGGKRPSEELPASIRKLDGSFTCSLRETGERLLEQLVPEDSELNESAEQMAVRRETGISVGTIAPVRPGLIPSGDPVKLCDVDEVKMAIWRIESRKAAGLDGITSGILKQAWPVLAEPITHAFNCALRSRIFPGTWKDAALVIIRKGPGKDPTEAKSYRPISLLPVLAKALEGIIVSRIRVDTDSRMSARQYGFTKDRSTVDANKPRAGMDCRTHGKVCPRSLSRHNGRI